MTKNPMRIKSLRYSCAGCRGTRNKEKTKERIVFKSVSRVLAIGLLLAPVSVLAAPITVDFTLTSTSALGVGNDFGATQYNGFALGSTGTGSFTIDDSIGNYSSFNVGVTPIDFSFDWAGVSFTEANAQLWQIGFDGAGGINYWGFGTFGGSCENLNCVSAVGAADFFASGYGGAYVSNGVTGVSVVHQTDVYGWMNGTLTWNIRPATSVPEPATLALLAIGLLGAAVSRRKRAL
jgi:hypothetical protein